MPVTDTHILALCNHTTGERFSGSGTEAECKALAAEKRKEWKKGDKVEVIIEKR